jgi:hypothetical protein
MHSYWIRQSGKNLTFLRGRVFLSFHRVRFCTEPESGSAMFLFSIRIGANLVFHNVIRTCHGHDSVNFLAGSVTEGSVLDDRGFVLRAGTFISAISTSLQELLIS